MLNISNFAEDLVGVPFLNPQEIWKSAFTEMIIHLNLSTQLICSHIQLQPVSPHFIPRNKQELLLGKIRSRNLNVLISAKHYSKLFRLLLLLLLGCKWYLHGKLLSKTLFDLSQRKPLEKQMYAHLSKELQLPPWNKLYAK